MHNKLIFINISSYIFRCGNFTLMADLLRIGNYVADTKTTVSRPASSSSHTHPLLPSPPPIPLPPPPSTDPKMTKNDLLGAYIRFKMGGEKIYLNFFLYLSF